MKRANKAYFVITAILFLLFIVFTVLVKTVDVAVPPFFADSPEVGFESLNTAVHQALGQSELWYDISDAMGIFAILTLGAFGILGFVQLVSRKSIKKVDGGILLLGAFYVLVAVCYVLFECIVINYRPIPIEGVWEASYPSSHTILICCIMSTAIVEFCDLVKNKIARIGVGAACSLMIAVTVIGRLLSGVHWLTDIIGGVLLSAALIMLYISALQVVKSGKSCF